MAHCNYPESGPSGLVLEIAKPLSGPSDINTIINTPSAGPTNTVLNILPPLSGPTNLAFDPPAVGPSSLALDVLPPASGPDFIFLDSTPLAGPSDLSVTPVPPASGPSGLSANDTLLGRDPPAQGPTGLTLALAPAAPAAGPSFLVADQRSYILTDEEFIDPGVNMPSGYTVFRTGSVNNKKPGVYTLTYTLRDRSTGLTSTLERKVVVIQRPPPVIELDGSHTYYVPKGSAPFVPPTATNPEGFTVFTVNNVDTLREGSYQVIYYVQDEYKNMGMETVTVHVVLSVPAPAEGPGGGDDGGLTVSGPATLTVTGGNQTLELGVDTWFDPGVTTNEDGVTISVTYEKEN